MLPRADPDRLADRRHAMPGNIASGDVTPAVGRGGQETQAGKVLDAGDAGAARGGPLDNRVLGFAFGYPLAGTAAPLSSPEGLAARITGNPGS